jgi:hypothetical protein
MVKSPAMPSSSKDKKKAEHHYWRVIVTYSDGETSGNRVFKDRSKAERWAERQKKSGVVKKAVLESFFRQQYGLRRASVWRTK